MKKIAWNFRGTTMSFKEENEGRFPLFRCAREDMVRKFCRFLKVINYILPDKTCMILLGAQILAMIFNSLFMGNPKRIMRND